MSLSMQSAELFALQGAVPAHRKSAGQPQAGDAPRSPASHASF